MSEWLKELVSKSTKAYETPRNDSATGVCLMVSVRVSVRSHDAARSLPRGISAASVLPQRVVPDMLVAAAAGAARHR